MPPPSPRVTVAGDGSAGEIRGLAIPYGSPSRLDSQGEFFSKNTDLSLDLIAGERPVLFHHGLADGGRIEVVGRVKEFVQDAAGIVATVILDRASSAFGPLMERAKAGLLGFSSGAVSHLVRTNPLTGEIQRWPWVELSLTPTPSSPDAQLYSVKGDLAIAHLAAVGIGTPRIKSLLTPYAAMPADLEVLRLENELAIAKRSAGNIAAADRAWLEFVATDLEVDLRLGR